MPTEIMLQANTSPGGSSRPVTVASARTAGAGATAGVPSQQDAPPVNNGGGGTVNREELQAAIEQLSSYVQNVQRNLNFSVDETSGQMIVKVIDSESEEVIRQIPSEEMLAVARRLRELSGEQTTGLLVQSRA